MEVARILIVEDEGIVALDIENTLTRLGYQVCGIAATGSEALQLALDNQPDLILMDIRLAGEMDGIEAAERVHAVLDVPIIFLTAYTDRVTLERAKTTQPFGYITKPLEIKDLQTTIEIALYRHAMERRERENAYRFEQVFNTVAHGLILLDADCVIQIANQQAQDYLKILAQPDILKIGERLNYLNGRKIEDYIISSAGTHTPQLQEIVLVEPQERVFVVDVVPLTNSPNKPGSANSGWVLTIRDISDARKHEHAQRQQEHLAAIGRLTAGIAHEYGNILAAIQLSAQIVLQIEDNLDAKSVAHLERIRERVHRANNLVSQVRDFSRKSYFAQTDVDLVSVYEEWMTILEHTLPENVELRFSYAQVPCIVHVDPAAMQHILWNLVLNACDALPYGGVIQVEIDRVIFDGENRPPLPELAGGEWVRVRVADNGIGIAPEVLPQIFEPFFTTKEPGQGTGLGLAQVYGLVQQHEGFVHVSTMVENGTTFTVFLPAPD